MERAQHLIKSIINKLELDLSGKTVLTEVGSNHFNLTPLIPLMANAKKVFAWSRISPYGTAEENAENCLRTIRRLKLDSSKISFACNERPLEHVAQSDIITNLGFVRPIDKTILSQTKPGVVVPLMHEAWEFRSEDIDVEYCRSRSIPVAGTWENHPKLRIFDGCGPLAAKVAFEAGFELFTNNVLIYSPDHFGEIIRDYFKQCGAGKVTLVKSPAEWNKIKDDSFDFLFVCDYTSNSELIGNGGVLKASALKNKTLVHLAGAIDDKFCNEENIHLYPARKGYSKRMTFTLAHLGPKFMIDLHTAGFKVGELMLKRSKSKMVQYIVQ